MAIGNTFGCSFLHRIDLLLPTIVSGPNRRRDLPFTIDPLTGRTRGSREQREFGLEHDRDRDFDKRHDLLMLHSSPCVRSLCRNFACSMTFYAWQYCSFLFCLAPAGFLCETPRYDPLVSYF